MVVACFLVLMAGMFSGCGAVDKSPPGSPFLVAEPRTQFFKYGPAQSFGADFLLPKGQRVILLQRSVGFAKVMTDDGISGWVAKEDIVPAPPEPRRVASTIPKRDSGGQPRLYSGPRKASNLQPVPGDPLFDMSDLPPPPLPDDPDLPAPKFRVTPQRSR